jgi:hypothetical protein
MVDPWEDGAENEPPLLDQLRGAPQKILNFVTEAATTYVGHALGLVKSFWPKARLEVLAGAQLLIVLMKTFASTC